MATQRFYKVQLTPAKIDARGVVSFLLFDPGTKSYDVTASTLPEMQAKVRALVADDFQRTAACYVRLANKSERKPAGFDKATREIQTIEHVGACILTAENMHTADDCTMHDHEPV